MSIELPWKLYSMEMDAAGKILGRFFEKLGYGIERTNPVDAAAEMWKDDPDVFTKHGNLLAAYCKKETIEEAVKAAIQPMGERALVVYGSGDYHHYTYGLAKLAERLSEEFTYIHIDNHHDWYRKSHYMDISCNNFTGHIARYTKNDGIEKPKNMAFIGRQLCESQDSDRVTVNERHFMCNEMRQDNFRALKAFLGVNPKEAYLSIDLDIMHPKEARTAYWRGDLRKEELLEIINIIKDSKQLIGADVLGYCIQLRDSDITSKWEPSFPFLKRVLQRKKTLQLYKSIVDAIIDKNTARIN